MNKKLWKKASLEGKVEIAVTVRKGEDISGVITATPFMVGKDLFAGISLSCAADTFPELHDYILHISVIDMDKQEQDKKYVQLELL